jgi:hypothetical protein
VSAVLPLQSAEPVSVALALLAALAPFLKLVFSASPLSFSLPFLCLLIFYMKQ